MYKLVDINKSKTIYSVLDTVTGRIEKFSRKALIEASYDWKIQGVDNKYAQVKIQKPYEKYFSSFEQARLVSDIVESLEGSSLKGAVNIIITTLENPEDLLMAKMLYKQGRCDDNVFIAWDGNDLVLYTCYDRVVFLSEYVSFRKTSIVEEFPFKVAKVKNKDKFIDINSGGSIFDVCIQEGKR